MVVYYSAYYLTLYRTQPIPVHILTFTTISTSEGESMGQCSESSLSMSSKTRSGQKQLEELCCFASQ